MITMAGAHSSCSSRKGSNLLSEVLLFNWDTPVREPNSHRCHMTFTDLKKTEFWGAPRHWIGFWVKKKKRREKKREKNNQRHRRTHQQCHQHQERPVQIGRYPFRNHTSFSSVLLLVVYSLTQRTFFFTPEAHPACMGAGDTRCGSPSQQGYRHVGLHERVPPDSRKARRSIIQPQHPANLNAAAPSFQSKMLSGSARLWHSACSLALRRSQSRKRSQLHRARRTSQQQKNFALTRTSTSLWPQSGKATPALALG